MANVVRLDRLSIEGLDLFNAWVECTVSAVERALNVQGSGGIKIEKTATGLIIKMVPAGDVWGYLAAGQTVSAASGLTLGSGTVSLYQKNPNSGVLTSLGQTVTVYNAGGGVAGGSVGYAVKLGVMRDGSYSLDVAPCAAAV